MKKLLFPLSVLLLALFTLASCSGENTEAGGNGETMAATTKKSAELVVPVEVTLIKKQLVKENINYTGVAEAINSVDLIAEVGGKIETVNKKLGDKISTADVLAIIDDRVPLANFKQAESQVLSAENNLDIAKSNLESDKELFASGDISKLAFDNSRLAVKTAQANLMAARAQLSLMEKNYTDTKITSPINGIIARKNVNIGTMANIGMPVYRVVDLSTMKVKLGVSQSSISKISKGDKATLSVSSLNGKKLEGAVKFISPQANESTGTFEVEVHFKNTPDYSVKAGMTASIELIVSQETPMLVIPDYSIVSRNGTASIYKIESDRAKLIDVVLGETYGTNVEVLSGLNEGDHIVTVGMKNLGVNTKVQIEKRN